MAKYPSWPTTDQGNIVGGRLANEMYHRFTGGLNALSNADQKDAALAELLATTPEGFNVKSFGAKGDGVTDDTAALQAVIDTVVAAEVGVASLPGRGPLMLVPEGRYLHTGLTVAAGGMLRMSAHGAEFELAAAGTIGLDVQGTSRSRCGLEMYGGSWFGQDTGTGIKLAWVTDTCIMKDQTIAEFSDGLLMEELHSAVVENLRVLSCASRGVYLNGGQGTAGIFGCTFTRLFSTNNDIGMLVRGLTVENVLLRPLLRANGTNELQIRGTTVGGASNLRVLGGHFERGSTSPTPATVAVSVDIEAGGTRPEGNIFRDCVFSGSYTRSAEVGQAISTRFIDSLLVGTGNSVVTTHANARDTRVIGQIRTDAVVDFTLGTGNHVVTPSQGRAQIGDIALSAGWGSTASSSGFLYGSGQLGVQEAFALRVTSAGTGQGANPTITFTFEAPWGTRAEPIYVVGRSAGDQLTVVDTWVVTPTTLVITFNGTPVAAETYDYMVIAG